MNSQVLKSDVSRLRVCFPKKRVGCFACGIFLAVIAFLSTAEAITPEVITLRRDNQFNIVPGPFTDETGKSVAVNDRWVLVGQPGTDFSPNGNEGSVQVHRASDGRYMGMLEPGVTSQNANFGTSVALCGDIAIVGAPGEQSGDGAVFFFDVRTRRELNGVSSPALGAGFGLSVAASGAVAVIGAPGAFGDQGLIYLVDLEEAAAGNPLLLFPIAAGDGQANDGFGQSVAISDQLVLVGAPGDDSAQGSAYLFSTAGTLIEKIAAQVSLQAGDLFGFTVALEGKTALIGAPGTGALDEGAAYLMPITNGASLLHTLTLGASAFPSAGLGWQVALRDGMALVGMVGFPLGSAAGEVWMFSRLSGLPIGRFTGTAESDQFADQIGFAIAAHGNRVVVGAPAANGDEGMAFLFPNFSGPSPLFKVSATRDSAPGILEARIRQFSEVCLSVNDNRVSFVANLVGRDASRGRNQGVFGGANFQPMRLAGQRNHPSTTDQVRLFSVEKSNSNYQTGLFYEGQTTGGGREILKFDGTDVFAVHRVGKSVFLLNNAIIGRYLQRVHSHTLTDWATSVQLRRNQANGTTAANDSAILALDEFGAEVEVVREDTDPFGLGDLFGQLSRVSFHGDEIVFPAPFVTAAPIQNQVLVRWRPLNGGSSVFQKGIHTVPTTTDTVRTFLGENSGATQGTTLFRAALNTSQTTNGANNEVLIAEDSGTTVKVARKGESSIALGQGEVWHRFLKYWAMHAGPQPVALFTAKVRGAGVNGSNDCGLFYLREDGDIDLLLREGDPLPGACNGERIGVIQRVVADPTTGAYAMVVSLIGAPPGTNQAVLLGNCKSQDISRRAVRRPWVVMRKGRTYQEAFGQTSQVMSFNLPINSIDRTGAGGKGLPSAIGAISTVIMVKYQNGTTAVGNLLSY